MLNPISLRGALASNGVIPTPPIVLSNAVLLVSTFASAKNIANKSLDFTASLIHQSITEQGGYEQFDALTALTRKRVAQTGRRPVFGDGCTSLVVFSNWTKAKFFDLDFGAAVVRRGKTIQEGDVRFVSKPSFFNLMTQAKGMSPRGAWPILGEDERVGYWVMGNMRKDIWKGVERDLEVMKTAPEYKVREIYVLMSH